MKKTSFVALLFLLSAFPAFSQSDSISAYVKIALESNLNLKQERIQLEKAIASLKEAKGLFLPSINFMADYTYAKGGRTIGLPVGDLMNPVYSTLNALTNSNAFPLIENQSVQFLPNDFHDTRIRTTMPLINAEIWYLNKMRKESIQQHEAGLTIYRRDLVKEVKIACYRYIQLLKSIEILANARKLLNENLILTEQLVKQDKALPVAALQIKAELSKTEALLLEAENTSQSAQAYVNFLMNRPLQTALHLENSLAPSETEGAIPAAAKEREELVKLRSGISQTIYHVNLKRAYVVPQVSAFFDAGYQGFGYTFRSNQQYYLGGIQLRWNLFSGLQNSAKIQQAFADQHLLETKLDEAESQLQLQAFTAEKALFSAKAVFQGASESVRYSRESYRLIRLRYEQGLAIPLELTQALQELVQSELTQELKATEVKIRQAEVERTTASFLF